MSNEPISLEELKQQIAKLPLLQRAQILRFYPHLASSEVDNEELLPIEIELGEE